ncbi:MAG TPA: hypothetical protein VFN67_15335 [Polyangiales bacterium]|nr:hypothetical protein [Polyangiales bacterium]
MMEEQTPPKRLVPARPDFSEAKQSGILPGLPWRIIGGLGLVLLVVVVGFNWRQEQRAAALRVELRRIHGTELKALRGEYSTAIHKLEGLIASAAHMRLDAEMPLTGLGSKLAEDLKAKGVRLDERHVDESLRFEDLRGAPGLYLRLPLDQIGNAAQIAQAAQQMDPDWIPACLGWNPTTGRELYEIGAFILPEFIAHIDRENVMKLRVREDTLKLRMEKDVPGLRAAMHAPWFMLVLQEGKSRSEQPVRVFLWDMKQEKLLLAARVQAQGILLTSKILSQGSVGGPATQAEGGAAQANDCSIASALRRLPH